MSGEVKRCKVTGNPVGTDTWGNGNHCRCMPCVEHMRETSPRVTEDDMRRLLAMRDDADARSLSMAKLKEKYKP